MSVGRMIGFVYPLNESRNAPPPSSLPSIFAESVCDTPEYPLIDSITDVNVYHRGYERAILMMMISSIKTQYAHVDILRCFDHEIMTSCM